MTPRAYWDRDGFLHEEHPEVPELIRVIWSPRGELEYSAWNPKFEIENLFGPLVGVA
jgi:hypothetical protein